MFYAIMLYFVGVFFVSSSLNESKRGEQNVIQHLPDFIFTGKNQDFRKFQEHTTRTTFEQKKMCNKEV